MFLYTWNWSLGQHWIRHCTGQTTRTDNKENETPRALENDTMIHHEWCTQLTWHDAIHGSNIYNTWNITRCNRQEPTHTFMLKTEGKWYINVCYKMKYSTDHITGYITTANKYQYIYQKTLDAKCTEDNINTKDIQ